MPETDSQNLLDHLSRFDGGEVIDSLVETGSVRIERIVSWGAVSPPEGWYDEATAEWVMVLQGEGELEFDDGKRQVLRACEAVYIAPRRRHRVVRTSAPCVWLAVHFEVLAGSHVRVGH